MKYEKPEVKINIFNTENIVTDSVVSVLSDKGFTSKNVVQMSFVDMISFTE